MRVTQQTWKMALFTFSSHWDCYFKSFCTSILSIVCFFLTFKIFVSSMDISAGQSSFFDRALQFFLLYDYFFFVCVKLYKKNVTLLAWNFLHYLKPFLSFNGCLQSHKLLRAKSIRTGKKTFSFWKPGILLLLKTYTKQIFSSVLRQNIICCRIAHPGQSFGLYLGIPQL